MTTALANGRVITIANNTPYAIPVGPYRIFSLLELEYSATVDGVYTTLVGSNSEPGARVSGGFIRCPTVFTPLILKKISTLSDAYAAVVSRSGPFFYKRLNEQSGDFVYDSIDRNYDQEIAAGSTLAETGPLGDGSLAIEFDGISGQAFTENDLDPQLDSEALSFEAWVYNTSWSASHEMIISLGSAGIYMSVVNAKLIMSIVTIGTGQLTARTIASLPVDTWTHVVVTWESGDIIRLYINGFRVAQDAETVRSGELESSPNQYLGSFGGGALFFSGKIAQPAIYLRKLEAKEVLAHFAAASNQ